MTKKDDIHSKIISELGLDGLPKKRQDDILAKIGELILKKIFLKVVDELSDEDRASFEKMLKNGETAENIEKFLNEKIKNYDKMVEKIVEEIKKEIKGE